MEEVLSKKGNNDKNAHQSLVIVLTKLVLQNSQELRTIIGCIFATWLRKSDENIVERMGLKSGVQYDTAAKDMKAKKEQAEKEGAEEVDLETLGPPYLHLWAALVGEVARETDETKNIPDHIRTPFVDHWNSKVSKAKTIFDIEGVAVKVFRVKALRTGNKKGWVKVQACFVANSEMEPAFFALMNHLTFQLKVGPAPRGALEREAQKLLEQARRK